MNNDNPDEMSNLDLENDMQQRNNEKKLAGNQEDVSLSTAAEGTLKTPSEDTSSAAGHHTSHNAGEEKDLDDLVHRRAEEDSQDGSLPNPEDVPAWEGDETDDDKMTG